MLHQSIYISHGHQMKVTTELNIQILKRSNSFFYGLSFGFLILFGETERASLNC